jgi:hypothetical protein
MSYLITGIVFSLISWYITRQADKVELNKSNTLLIENMVTMLRKNNALLKQIEELKSEIVVIKSMRGE